jgi:hypothetical protein
MKPRKLWKKLAQPLSLSSKKLLKNAMRRVPLTYLALVRRNFE